MRFRRRQKILPGVYLNFSGSGISTTIGVPGASVNFGRNGTYLNTGIPGTGLYNRQRIDSPNNSRNQYSNSQSYNSNSNQVNSINSNNASQLTSNSLIDLKNTFHDCYLERADIIKEIKKTKRNLFFFKLLYFISSIILIGFIFKWFKNNVTETKEYENDLLKQLENCIINIDLNINNNIINKFSILTNKYQEIISCSKIWDLISVSSLNQRVSRTSAEASIERKEINFKTERINIIKSKFMPLHFANANGGDIYIYPAFIFYFENENDFALIDIRNLEISIINQSFIEEETLPNDATIVKRVWAKSNADGSPDRRFKNNYQIPVCQYGRINFKTTNGLNEAYMFSNYNKAYDFAQALHSHIQQTKI